MIFLFHFLLFHKRNRQSVSFKNINDFYSTRYDTAYFCGRLLKVFSSPLTGQKPCFRNQIIKFNYRLPSMRFCDRPPSVNFASRSVFREPRNGEPQKGTITLKTGPLVMIVMVYYTMPARRSSITLYMVFDKFSCFYSAVVLRILYSYTTGCIRVVTFCVLNPSPYGYEQVNLNVK